MFDTFHSFVYFGGADFVLLFAVSATLFDTASDDNGELLLLFASLAATFLIQKDQKINETQSEYDTKLVVTYLHMMFFLQKWSQTYYVFNIADDFIYRNILVNNIDAHEPIMFSLLFTQNWQKPFCF